MSTYLYDGQSQSTQAEDSDGRPGLHLDGVEHGAPARGDPAAQQAHAVQVSPWMYFGRGDLSNNCIFSEGGTSHEMIDGFPVFRQSTGAIRHKPLALSASDGWA